MGAIWNGSHIGILKEVCCQHDLDLEDVFLLL